MGHCCTAAHTCAVPTHNCLGATSLCKNTSVRSQGAGAHAPDTKHTSPAEQQSLSQVHRQTHVRQAWRAAGRQSVKLTHSLKQLDIANKLQGLLQSQSVWETNHPRNILLAEAERRRLSVQHIPERCVSRHVPRQSLPSQWLNKVSTQHMHRAARRPPEQCRHVGTKRRR